MVALWGTAAVGCFSPEPAVGLGCADGDPRCPEGQVCDDAAGVCVPDSAIDTWREDTAADFSDPTAVLVDGSVEANGAIGPAPYFVDGLATFGIPRTAIGDGNEGSVTWDALVAQTISGHGFARGVDLAYSSTEPVAGTGIAAATNFTMGLEGEIYLDAGTTEFSLDADDRGFMDIADTASGYRRVASADVGPDGSGSVTTAAAGWFPFRGAYENASSSAKYEILSRAPGGSFDHVPPERLRVRVDALTGLALDGFDDPRNWVPRGTTLAMDPLADQQYGTGHPPDAGDVGQSSWTMRWSGQVLVTTAGSYSFALDTEGGHRMWLDGVQVADTDRADLPQQTTTAPATLDAGWHDLVLDLMKDAGSTDSTHLRLTVASGPELVGSFFPVDRMRPVVGRGARWIYGAAGLDVAITEGGTVTKTFWVNRPPGIDTVLLADYEYSLTHAALATLGITLARPGASTTTLVTAGDLSGMGTHAGRVHFTNIRVDGGFALTVTDTNATDTFTGTLTNAMLSATYAGGARPFPTHTLYTSRVRELGPVVAISGVRWQTRQDPGGRVQVRVRSCATAEACAAEPWTDVAASGDAAGVPARPFAQYQVEINGDGDVPTALDWIEIDYRL